MFSEIERLKKENEQLKKELEKVKHEKEKIEYQKQRIEKEFEDTKKEFEEFKLKHAGTVNELKKAMHLKPNLPVKKKGLGAKKGHIAYTRHIPTRIDHIVALNPKKCPQGHLLPKEASEIKPRYVTDIELVINVKNTQYDLYRKYCKECKKIITPTVPNVLPNATYGLNLMLLVLYLRIGMRLPINKIQDFFTTLCGLTLSEGEIVLICHQLARAYGPYYKHLKKILKLARVKYTDTTSWRTDAKNYVAWVFITIGAVLYKITRHANAAEALKVFGKKQQGNTLVVDRHSVNRCLAEQAGFTLQFCWSHILDDSRGLAKNFGREGAYVHRKLKQIFADAASLNHQGTPAQVKALEKRILKLHKKRYTHTTVRKWVKNLAERDLHGLFIFVTNPDVDPTNNISERDLRKLVMHRKTSNGSRSVAGAETIAVLYSVVETLKQTKKPLFPGLKEILTSQN